MRAPIPSTTLGIGRLTRSLGRDAHASASLMRRRSGAAVRTDMTPACSALLFAATTAVVTALMAWTGGAPSTLGHLYYIPILYVAVRHGARAAAVAGVVAGLAAGPWMRSSIEGVEHQKLSTWLVRLVLLVVVGVVAAWLAREEPRPLAVTFRDLALVQRLRAAIRHDHVKVHFQPLIDLNDGTVGGVEALCRWTDPQRGPMSPATFIPAAERRGVIDAVGRRVLDRSLDQAKRWVADGQKGFLVTVNVSAVQLSDPRFMTELAAAVNRIEPGEFRLCVEITETAIMADPARALTTLRAARALGVRIALDDFGTGQSSLAYLADFPIDIIKIDQSFVANVGRDSKSHALVNAMVQMAHSLGALTIAEGIETPAQLEALRSLGCTMGQGYYLGRPAEASAVVWESRDLAFLTDRQRRAPAKR